MNISVLTSCSYRHLYLLGKLLEEPSLSLGNVLMESKGKYYASEDEHIRSHMSGFETAERDLLGECRALDLGQKARRIGRGEVNKQEHIEWVMESAPDFIILMGTSIVDHVWLELFPDRIINIHLGLSPYYRGTATNFWPLVYREPQCVGATIHIASPIVDDGAILRQVRPDICIFDNCHTMGCKTIIKAVEVLPATISDYYKGYIRPAKTATNVNVFRRKDFSSASVLKMRQNFENGMLEEYLADKNLIDSRFSIIT